MGLLTMNIGREVHLRSIQGGKGMENLVIVKIHVHGDARNEDLEGETALRKKVMQVQKLR